MASSINASTTGAGGLVSTADSSGVLDLQAGGTSVVKLTGTSSQPRITGDFSNATFANRVMFQTSTTNGNTSISALPNGTSTQSQFLAYNNVDPANASFSQVVAISSEISLRSGIAGTGTYLPMTLYTNGSEQMRIATDGTLSFNSGYGSAGKAYGCRAWVNFNGTGTVAIRASGNVTSITDNGTGDYTINFTTAMPDANYSVVGSTQFDTNAAYLTSFGSEGLLSIKRGVTTPLTTTSARIGTGTTSSNALSDTTINCVAIHR